jgi:hypothetical protein
LFTILTGQTEVIFPRGFNNIRQTAVDRFFENGSRGNFSADFMFVESCRRCPHQMAIDDGHFDPQYTMYGMDDIL